MLLNKKIIKKFHQKNLKFLGMFLRVFEKYFCFIHILNTSLIKNYK